MIKALIHFLFGKSPDIFDPSGQVQHKLPEEKWQAWNNRYKTDRYDWRHHKGTGTKSRKQLQ